MTDTIKTVQAMRERLDMLSHDADQDADELIAQADELIAQLQAGAQVGAAPPPTDAQIIEAAKGYDQSQPPSAKHRLSLMLLNSDPARTEGVTVGDFQKALCGVVRAAQRAQVGAAPPVAREPTVPDIEAIAHRNCSRYQHNSADPNDTSKATYLFDRLTLWGFVAAIGAQAGEAQEARAEPWEVEQRGRSLWMRKGCQSFQLAYTTDEDAELRWFADTVRAALKGQGPVMKAPYFREQEGQE